MKKVLLIGDLVGHEKIAISAMIPILSNMNCSVNNLLTTVISNSFDYGITEICDLTSYMENTIDCWKKLNFKFDIIFVGYINSMRQVELIEDLIDFNDNPLVINDPIMGDNGKLYNNITDEVKKYTRKMTNSADIIVPNLTEAAILLNKDFPRDLDNDTMTSWLDELSGGTKSVIITSVKIHSKHYVYGIDKGNDKFRVEFEWVPHRFAGTGDIFSSLLVGKLCNSASLKESVQYACNKITEILKTEAKDSMDDHQSVNIEKYIKDL